MCSKEDIRKSIRQKKKLLSSEDKLQAAELVFKQLFQLEQWKKANPNWNKVLLIPVDAQYTTYNAASLLTSISHNMSLTSVRLVGGTENPNGDIEVSVIYSKFHE